MGTTVAHGDKNIVFLQFNDGFINILFADGHFCFRIIPYFFITDDNDVGVIVLDQFRGFIIQQMDNGKGCVRNAANGAYGQRCGDGFYTVLKRDALCHHRGNDLGGQRGKNARFYTASESVGQNDDRGIVVRLHDVNVVAAELFSVMIYTFISDVST